MAFVTSTVSSAYRKVLASLTLLHKSLIYNKNNNGPRTDPWGTPQEMALNLGSASFTIVFCFLCERHFYVRDISFNTYFL